LNYFANYVFDERCRLRWEELFIFPPWENDMITIDILDGNPTA
jgi:hypothetical protein